MLYYTVLILFLEFCFFATLGSSFFLWGFSQKMSNWKKKDHSFDGKVKLFIMII